MDKKNLYLYKEVDSRITRAFANQVRLRLPGLHQTVTYNAGVALRDHIASVIFMNLHDRYEHDCPFVGDLKWDIAICPVHFSFAEWSFLDNEVAEVFYQMADFAIREAQLWSASGACDIISLPAYGGDILMPNPEFRAADGHESHRKPSARYGSVADVIAEKFFELAHDRFAHDCDGRDPHDEWTNLDPGTTYQFYLSAGFFVGAVDATQRWVGAGIEPSLELEGFGSLLGSNVLLGRGRTEMYDEKQQQIDLVTQLRAEIGTVPAIP